MGLDNCKVTNQIFCAGMVLFPDVLVSNDSSLWVSKTMSIGVQVAEKYFEHSSAIDGCDILGFVNIY